MARPITVIFPVYNCAEYLKEAVDSVLNQTFKDFELLAINDGSTDNSVEILESYDDERIRLVHNEQNMGLIATLNKGLDLCESPYIVRADADDICMSTRLEQQFNFMESNPEVGLSGTWYVGFTEKGEMPFKTGYLTGDDDIRIKHLYQLHVSHGTSIIRKKILDEHNLRFDPDYQHAEDYDLFVRMSQHCKLANIPEILYKVRYHEASVSHKFNDIQTKNSNRVMQRQFKLMGIDLSDNEVVLYKQMAYGDFSASKDKMEQTRELYGKLIAANKLSGYVPHEKFANYLATIWFHHCLNVKSIKQRYRLFRGAFFHIYYPLAPMDRVKLLIKR